METNAEAIDRFFEYEFEEVMFRIEGKTGLIYRKFYNEPEELEPIPHHTRIFADTLLFGKEITKETYMAAREASSR